MITIQQIRDAYCGPHTIQDRKNDLEEGQFGAVAGYWCERHDTPVWDKPRAICTHRQTFYEPAEYEDVCPECGYIECVYEHEDPAPFKLKRRYTTIHRAALAA